MRYLGISFLALLALSADPVAGYKLVKSVPVPGDGGWDYLIVDEVGRRVYISHGTKVDVLDADTFEAKGEIPDTQGVHGIALAPDLGRGFTSNGRANTVTAFDLKTLKTLGTVETGKNPDCIIYDAFSKRVFAFNGGSKSVTVIGAEDMKVAATVELGGKPEFAVTDLAGNVFVNNEETSELLKIDAREPKVLERYPLAPAEKPSSLAIDVKNHRIFSGCRNKKLAVIDSETGKVVTTVAIGEGVDATMYEAETGRVFSSCGDGTVAIVKQTGKDDYKVEGTLKTKPRAKTFALDPKTHRLFLPSAEYKAAGEATKENPRPRPAVVPGSFTVLVYGN